MVIERLIAVEVLQRYIRACNSVRLVFLVKWKRRLIIKQLKVT